MNTTNPNPARNPETKRLHTRQTFWQIFLPIFGVILLVLAAGILAATSDGSNGGGPRVWAEISEIWILIPMLVLSLVLLFILGMGIYGVGKAIHHLPGIGLQVQTFMYKAAVTIRTYADKAVTPLLTYHQTRAGLGSLFKRK